MPYTSCVGERPFTIISYFYSKLSVLFFAQVPSFANCFIPPKIMPDIFIR